MHVRRAFECREFDEGHAELLRAFLNCDDSLLFVVPSKLFDLKAMEMCRVHRPFHISRIVQIESTLSFHQNDIVSKTCATSAGDTPHNIKNLEAAGIGWCTGQTSS